jgi:hypothetical protein
MIIFILVGLASLIVGYFIGYFRQKSKVKKVLTQGTGRFGILEYNWLDHKFTLEIEEIEEAGSLTKVRLVKVYKTTRESYSTEDLLDKIKFKEWIPTNQITWFNNNSQKIRDNKINQILGS